MKEDFLLKNLLSNKMNTCPKCDGKFSCQVTNPNGCWCMDFPPLLAVERAENCLCKTCLEKEIEMQQNKEKQKPQPLVINEDYYIENGRWVFTSAFHLKRGKCCGSNCRHCPFEHVNVR